MTSHPKIRANRKNAKLSTGPRTMRGKKIASQNAVRHGLATNNQPISSVDLANLAKIFGAKELGTRADKYAKSAAREQLLLSKVYKLQADLMGPLWKQFINPKAMPGGLIVNVVSGLSKLERYERGALARRRRSIRLLKQVSN